MDRRDVLRAIAGLGVGTPVFHRAIAAMSQAEGEITADMIAQAEWVAGIELSEEDREATARGVTSLQRSVANLRAYEIDYSDLPAVHFQVLDSESDSAAEVNRAPEIADLVEPDPQNDEELAFLPVSQLAKLIRTRRVTSTDLTKLYLDRLKRFNPVLNCVVSLTEETALKQAAEADRQIAGGEYKGPLHGIPWGAKDLISYPGYRTTWGAPQFREQQFDGRATVAERLDNAGAVLVAKLSLGALAMGDRWFGGRTNSPWNPSVGSSGSSAGSASAVVAGLCGFTIGSETLGSIVSPSRRCGATGLRPTFGRVSRHGCMPLSWTMDKLGPITRSVEDCALVFSAILGSDGFDPTVVDRGFAWPHQVDFSGIKVGFTDLPRRGRRNEEGEDDEPSPRSDLDALRALGCELVKVELPDDFPLRDITKVLDVEAATVFDPLTRNNDTEGLNAWGGIFRQAEFMTAVDYLRAMRIRRRLMFAMEELMKEVDFLVNTNDLVITNLTGHPSVVMPWSYREQDGVKSPVSLILTGRSFDESRLLALASAVQSKTDAHLQHPPMDAHLAANEDPNEGVDD